MENNHNNNPNQQHDKNNHFNAQLRNVFKAFFESPKTMKEVDVETGVMRENICWYCRELRKQNKLFPVQKRRCKITQHPRVIAWTTNPNLVPESSAQLNLF